MTFDDIIDFLLSLLRDDDAQAAFAQDPEGSLAAAGLEGVTGQDVRDARLQLADSGAVTTSSASSPPGGSDPIQEIGFTTRNFSAGAGEPGPADVTTTFIDQSRTFTIDDRDITVDDSDTTIINDSFNSDDDVVAIQDNSVDNSVVTNDVVAIQDNDVVNNDNDVIDINSTTVNDVLDEAPLPDEPTPDPVPEPEPEPDLTLDPADGQDVGLDEPADPLADAAIV